MKRRVELYESLQRGILPEMQRLWLHERRTGRAPAQAGFGARDAVRIPAMTQFEDQLRAAPIRPGDSVIIMNEARKQGGTA